MNKIFRWTIGDTNSQGIDILKESIKQTKKSLKNLGFEFIVCCNGNKEKVEKICLETKTNLFIQNWKNDFPLPDIIPKEHDIDSAVGIPSGRQGSFWKLCPPRLDIDSYEIVADNDVIIQKRPDEIEIFLEKNKVLISEDNLMAFGKYTKYIKSKKFYNSGLFGLPPEFDFKKLLIKKWEETNKMQPLMSRDEQGLIVATLLDFNFIEIPKEKTCLVFSEGQGKMSKYDHFTENGFETQKINFIEFEPCKLDREIFHFLGANREEAHKYWKFYSKNKKIVI